MNSLSLYHQHREEQLIRYLKGGLIEIDDYIQDVEVIEQLELLKERVNNAVDILNNEIDEKLRNLKLCRKFDLEKVKTLPVDIINLIKEFMIDDYEYVRKSVILFSFNNIFSSRADLEYRVTCLCKKITNPKLCRLIQFHSGMYIPKYKNKNYYIQQITSELYYFYRSFNNDIPLQINKNEISNFSLNKRYTIYQLLCFLSR
jgi:hypothetical protein